MRKSEEADQGQADLFEIQSRPSQKSGSDHSFLNLEDFDLETLKSLSLEAYTAALHACMSELPVERDIAQFIEKVIAAGGNDLASPEARTAAGKACLDRGAPSVLAVLNAAYKTSREIERLLGLLRFSPIDGGFYVARCAPDCFVLPALAEHFTLRFGDIPWAIIDEKRGLCLIRFAGEEARMESLDSEIVRPVKLQMPPFGAASGDAWENLWRLYHRSVNIENRKNLGLQRQLMPVRYWKYLPEANAKV
ncbi:TIGR03915 family putative DNA repair protein [Leadbettera azotonutricia]|uniref:DUF4130 domain-containing protein n=1 Tax=Leadbettera azotonutricia (strain ATCC BAA-888 / DSM 13862 / ZAS-9) TaxID=545695 RepID=F5YAF1_LEAAZ|nr:TIGR03915 family putative DNA repair protein [Leadbettera azotonutricia]AEF81903.1 conserved hypothetical protein [Leadbettera azotonutricia ZAS-9]